MDQLTDNQLDDLFKDIKQEKTASNFADVVMQKVEHTIEERKIIQPLIGKSTWIFIAVFFLAILTLSFFKENPSNLENGLSNLKQYGENVLDIFKSIWVYTILAVIILWEFVIRRQLSFN